jgi:hypothetical protein
MKLITRHGGLAFVILLLGAVFRLEPAAAEVLFKADFETGDFSQFSGKSKNIKPGHIEVVTDIVHSGKYAGRFSIHEDNVFNARQLRVQANGPKVTVKLIFYSCASVFDVTPLLMGRESHRSHNPSATPQESFSLFSSILTL